MRLASFADDENEQAADYKTAARSGRIDDGWRIGTTATGREYTWRYNPDAPEDDEPEVRLWTESVDDAGNTFWWDEGGSGAISLHDPFSAALRREA